MNSDIVVKREITDDIQLGSRRWPPMAATYSSTQQRVAFELVELLRIWLADIALSQALRSTPRPRSPER